MGRRYHIPFFQPLPPQDLISGARDLTDTFPFSAPRTHYYYMARNAIWHGLDALGLSPGDGILVPAYHHGVDLEVLLAKGLKPRFFRVDEAMRIDLEDMARSLDPGVKALFVIHYLGFPAPIDAIQAFARTHGLKLIEDCALSLFSKAPQGALGSFGDIGIFCLYKTLPLPHGGTLVLNREGLPAPPAPTRPDSLSSLAYIGNRSLDYISLRLDGVGPELASWGRNLARATKRMMRASTVPILTNELDTSVIPLGMGGAARYLLQRTNPAEVVLARRRNYEHLKSLLAPSVRVIFPELPEGVCPLSLPILVRDKERVHQELMADGLENVNFWARTRPEVPAERFPEVLFLRRHVLEVPIHQGIEPKHIEFISERVSKRAAW